MEFRINRSSTDEYEEVESPFAVKSSSKIRKRDKLRTKKNVFNRPFATESSNAPIYFETTGTRKAIGHRDDAELVHHRASELGHTEIEYLDEEDEVDEEEVVEKRPTRSYSTSGKKKNKLKKNLLRKVGWSVIGLLVLRLIFMDRGVWDYFSTESAIQTRQKERSSILRENKELKSEINRIQVDKNFQRQLAKEHLGVIAIDEFLILFAGESNELINSSTI